MQNSTSRHVIIFDALSSYGKWEPTSYGFPFYYRGNSILVSMGQIPSIARNLSNMNKILVLVVFHWKEYFLTSKSELPLISFPEARMEKIDYGLLNQQPLLQVKNFNGFSLIELKHPIGNTADDY